MLKYVRFVAFFLLAINLDYLSAETPANTLAINDPVPVERYQVAKVNYPRVSGAFEIALWIYLGILTKISNTTQVFHVFFLFKSQSLFILF